MNEWSFEVTQAKDAGVEYWQIAVFGKEMHKKERRN